MGDRVWVQFSVPDIYVSIYVRLVTGVGKWVPASAGKAKAGMAYSVSG